MAVNTQETWTCAQSGPKSTRANKDPDSTRRRPLSNGCTLALAPTSWRIRHKPPGLELTQQFARAAQRWPLGPRAKRPRVHERSSGGPLRARGARRSHAVRPTAPEAANACCRPARNSRVRRPSALRNARKPSGRSTWGCGKTHPLGNPAKPSAPTWGSNLCTGRTRLDGCRRSPYRYNTGGSPGP